MGSTEEPTMTAAEVVVVAVVVLLCVAVELTRATLDPRVSAILTTVALLAAAAVSLRRCFG